MHDRAKVVKQISKKRCTRYWQSVARTKRNNWPFCIKSTPDGCQHQRTYYLKRSHNLIQQQYSSFWGRCKASTKEKRKFLRWAERGHCKGFVGKIWRREKEGAHWFCYLQPNLWDITFHERIYLPYSGLHDTRTFYTPCLDLFWD